MTDRGKPLYMIGVVAEMLKVHPQTLRFYEKKGCSGPAGPRARRECTPRRTSKRSRVCSA